MPTSDGSMLLQRWLREGVSVTDTGLSLCPVVESSRGESITISLTPTITRMLQSSQYTQKMTAYDDSLVSVVSAELLRVYVRRWERLITYFTLLGLIERQKFDTLHLVMRVRRSLIHMDL